MALRKTSCSLFTAAITSPWRRCSKSQAGFLLLSGRFVNLALALFGPVVVNIALYHVFLVKGGYPMAIVLGVLSLVALAGRKNFMSALLAAN